MYPAINSPRHITSLGDDILLTAYLTIIQLLEYTGNSPHLLMRLHSPKIRSLILFWKPLVP